MAISKYISLRGAKTTEPKAKPNMYVYSLLACVIIDASEDITVMPRMTIVSLLILKLNIMPGMALV